MFRITLPSKLTGERYGLAFAGGVAETENAALAEKLRLKGLPVEGPEAEAPVEPEVPPEAPKAAGQPSGSGGVEPASAPVEPEEGQASPPEITADPEPSPEAEEQPATSEDPALAATLAALDKMTAAQLRDHAAEKGIDISGIAAKSNILAKIKAAESGG